jgi:hypothetical protein
VRRVADQHKAALADQIKKLIVIRPLARDKPVSFLPNSGNQRRKVVMNHYLVSPNIVLVSEKLGKEIVW